MKTIQIDIAKHAFDSGNGYALTKAGLEHVAKAAGVKTVHRGPRAVVRLGTREAVGEAPDADKAWRRAVRSLLGLRATYSLEELRQPFVVP